MFSFTRLGLLAMFIVSLALAGCGSEAEGDRDRGSNDAADAGDAKPVIGVSVPAATHGWSTGVVWWAEQAMAEHDDVQWQFKRAGDAAEQVAHIESMLAHGIDALVVLPVDSQTPLSAVQQAKDDDVYVVSVDRGLREPIADVYVAGDNTAFGRLSAGFIVEKLGFQGKIVILRGLPVEIDTQRYDAAMEIFNAHPGIEVLDTQRGNWSRQEAYQVMQTLLSDHDAIDAVWAGDDDMALGVEQALDEAGRTDERWIVGGGGMKDIIERVMNEDPLYPADVTYSPAMVAAGIHLAVAEVLYDGDEQAVAGHMPGHLGVEAADLLGATETRAEEQRNVILPVHLVTPENAEEYYAPDSVY